MEKYMYTFYLNSDRSLLCEISKGGNIFISSTHKNKRNSKQLCENISRIISTERKGSKIIIKLNEHPYVEINTANNTIKYTASLTSFETRLFSQGKNTESPQTCTHTLLQHLPQRTLYIQLWAKE